MMSFDSLYIELTGAQPRFERLDHGEREARAFKGVWGHAPSGVQEQSPWSGSQEADELSAHEMHILQ